MKFLLSIGVFVMLLLLPTIAMAEDTSTSDKPFTDTLLSVKDSLLGGLTWSTGYARSFDNPDKEGVVLKASRLITTVKFSEEYSIGFYGDLIGVESSNKTNDVVGLGISTNLKSLIGVDIGISYIAGGYGWSTTITPISFKF